MKLNRALVLAVVECPACGVEYGIPDHLNSQLLEQAGKGTAYCPSGHGWSYRGKSLEDRLAAAEAQATHERDQRKAAERAVTAARNEAARLRRRAANGVCPCCHRSFAQLGRHMKSKHPDYAP
jgi:hypothetical protein